jgi:hypothetical protein
MLSDESIVYYLLVLLSSKTRAQIRGVRDEVQGQIVRRGLWGSFKVGVELAATHSIVARTIKVHRYAFYNC